MIIITHIFFWMHGISQCQIFTGTLPSLSSLWLIWQYYMVTASHWNLKKIQRTHCERTTRTKHSVGKKTKSEYHKGVSVKDGSEDTSLPQSRHPKSEFLIALCEYQIYMHCIPITILLLISRVNSLQSPKNPFITKKIWELKIQRIKKPLTKRDWVHTHIAWQLMWHWCPQFRGDEIEYPLLLLHSLMAHTDNCFACMPECKHFHFFLTHIKGVIWKSIWTPWWHQQKWWTMIVWKNPLLTSSSESFTSLGPSFTLYLVNCPEENVRKSSLTHTAEWVLYFISSVFNSIFTITNKACHHLSQ